MHRKTQHTCTLTATSLFALLILAACGGSSAPGSSSNAAPLTFEQFKAQAYREPDTGVYIVDGDTALESEKQLRAFYEKHSAEWAAGVDPGSDLETTSAPLIVNLANGGDDRWGYTQQQNLTYCVSTTFGTNYAAVVSALAQAGAAWNGDVHFQHLADQDGSCGPASTTVIFDVRPISGQPYIARSFFPSTGRSNRNVLIDSSAFGNIAPWTLPGVLRHELGHTLGFRHEHTRPESGTCFEDNNWRALTNYDSASVMHYPQCNGTNRGDLVLTDRDLTGLQILYGPRPSSDIDPVYYLSLYGDLQAAFGSSNWTAAATHWSTNGAAEGRSSSLHFDVRYYLSHYGDLQAAFGPANWAAARNHWLSNGISEGRASSPVFDVGYYLSIHGDLQAAFGSTNYAAALQHWLSTGLYECRRSSPTFDVRYYLASNPDLQAAFGASNCPAAYWHYVQYGMSEGRRGAP
jgi:hypothetical protein